MKDWGNGPTTFELMGVDNFQRSSQIFHNSFVENLLQPPLFQNRNYVCAEWICVKESEKCENIFNKLSVRLQHVDFLWSLQIFFT
jgi:hypothetical protein